MRLATKAAASRKGYNPALQVAYKAGSVTGMLTAGLGLLGGTLIFIVFGIAAPDALLGFGFGGSLIALFMRVPSPAASTMAVCGVISPSP